MPRRAETWRWLYFWSWIECRAASSGLRDLLQHRFVLGGKRLSAEDLHHGLGLNLVDLSEGLCDQRAVFKSAGVQKLIEAIGGVTQKDLRVLEPLFVVGHGNVNLLSKAVDTLH